VRQLRRTLFSDGSGYSSGSRSYASEHAAGAALTLLEDKCVASGLAPHVIRNAVHGKQTKPSWRSGVLRVRERRNSNGRQSREAARMDTKIVGSLIVITFAISAQAQRADPDPDRRPVNEIMGGKPAGGDQRDSPRENEAVVIASPRDRARPTAHHEPGRNQGASTLLDRNRSPSPN